MLLEFVLVSETLLGALVHCLTPHQNHMRSAVAPFSFVKDSVSENNLRRFIDRIDLTVAECRSWGW